MSSLLLSIYDYFGRHRAFAAVLCCALTVGLLLSFLKLDYSEDISDFLPLDKDNQTALSVYQDVAGANNVYALVAAKDTAVVDRQLLVDGVEIFVAHIEEADSAGYIASIVKSIDLDEMMAVADDVFAKMPYFLTESDCQRIDSLLSIPGFIENQIAADKEALLAPTSGMIAANMSRDPLNLFAPVVGRLSGNGSSVAYATYDGYILSPDSRRAIVIMESAFGANESEHNAGLVKLLNKATEATELALPQLDIHIIGGPAIAVANANRIKSDSALAVGIAGVLILALLIYAFRSARNILLILISVGWGWLLAMGIIGLFYSSVSIIVVGIASVILGIAINYPLHLIDHLKESVRPREALREIIAPLLVGNVTTVGAFLCLVPLNAPALHDLGLFASLLLVGTIAFVLVFLPHAMKIARQPRREPPIITRLSAISLENKRWAVWAIVILTAIFGWFSVETEFDTDMRNINYMTPEQRADMDYFQSMSSKSGGDVVYVVSNGQTLNDALLQNEIVAPIVDSLTANGLAAQRNNACELLVSATEQAKRLARWNALLDKHGPQLSDRIKAAAAANGFSNRAFDRFFEIVNADYDVVEPEVIAQQFKPVLTGGISIDSQSGRNSIVRILDVKPGGVADVKNAIKSAAGFAGQTFDVASMNGSIASTLSDDFNYIGFVCGCIVFLFLWLSLGSIELAIISFLPMAVSWIWILGIMAMLGIKFNIVNVILATFIFGQGDDYTIFMTEGLSYELAYRKKLLASYKNSITVSALIMFIGIGTLTFAQHPAMQSLGKVTVIGMLSVVLMAYVFPPLLFNWLVRNNGRLRHRPITLKKVLCTWFCASVYLSQLFTGYIMGFFMLCLTRPTPRKRLLLHRYCCSVFRWDVKRMPGLRFRYDNPNGEAFATPAVIISNHQSLLDSFYLMTLSPKLIMIANDHVGKNVVTGRMFRWLGFITIGMGIEKMVERVSPYVAQGYSVAIFPEGERPRYVSNTVKRFHKGMIQFAEALRIDILPVYLHGIVQAMPKGSALSNGGEVVVRVGKRISLEDVHPLGATQMEQAQSLRRYYQSQFDQLCREQSTVKLLRAAVYDRYRYKGIAIEQKARRALKKCMACHAQIEDCYNGRDFIVVDCKGQGELAILLALIYPDRTVRALVCGDGAEVARGCIDNFVRNVVLLDSNRLSELDCANVNVVVVGSVEPLTANPTVNNRKIIVV